MAKPVAASAARPESKVRRLNAPRNGGLPIAKG
jgi:hypothetical protein